MVLGALCVISCGSGRIAPKSGGILKGSLKNGCVVCERRAPRTYCAHVGRSGIGRARGWVRSVRNRAGRKYRAQTFRKSMQYAWMWVRCVRNLGLDPKKERASAHRLSHPVVYLGLWGRIVRFAVPGRTHRTQNQRHKRGSAQKRVRHVWKQRVSRITHPRNQAGPR